MNITHKRQHQPSSDGSLFEIPAKMAHLQTNNSEANIKNTMTVQLLNNLNLIEPCNRLSFLDNVLMQVFYLREQVSQLRTVTPPVNTSPRNNNNNNNNNIGNNSIQKSDQIMATLQKQIQQTALIQKQQQVFQASHANQQLIDMINYQQMNTIPVNPIVLADNRNVSTSASSNVLFQQPTVSQIKIEETNVAPIPVNDGILNRQQYEYILQLAKQEQQRNSLQTTPRPNLVPTPVYQTPVQMMAPQEPRNLMPKPPRAAINIKSPGNINQKSPNTIKIENKERSGKPKEKSDFEIPKLRPCNAWSVVTFALPTRLQCKCYPAPCTNNCDSKC